MEYLRKRVDLVRTHLRNIQLRTILQQFDREKMQLSAAQQLSKYTNMCESPFRFFRGSAYVYYYDVSNIPSAFHTPDNRPTWIMGDMHMDNFGAFQNELGEIVFDVNDFDEGYVGSYMYDILRMTISMMLYLDEQQIDDKAQQTAVALFLSAYIKQLKRFHKRKDDPSTLSFTKDNTKGPVRRMLKRLEQRQRTHLVEDLTEINERGERSFKNHEDLQPIAETLKEQIAGLLPHYHVKDIVFKHGSGTASIGLDRFYILADSHADAAGYEDLILEMKEVRTAIPAYFVPYNEKFWAHFEHQGARVVGTQKAMHHLQDPHLHYVTMNGKQYYIRERSPYKRKLKPKNYRTFDDYLETVATMGKIAAKIHARADIDYSEAFSYNSEDEILKAIGDNEDIFIQIVTLQALRYKQVVYHDFELFHVYVEELRHAAH